MGMKDATPLTPPTAYADSIFKPNHHPKSLIPEDLKYIITQLHNDVVRGDFLKLLYKHSTLAFVS